MATQKSLADVYAAGLADLHRAEVLIGDALPAVGEAVADSQLRDILVEATAQTRRRAESIARILQRLGRDVDGTQSVGMTALLDGVHQAIREPTDARVHAPADMRIRDAQFIVGWRKVAHYRIAGYASACALAEAGDDDQDTEVLRDSLRETREEDEDLADLADSIINVQAPW
jgi:ferritin-like metal-binding protein YciE